jgi:hypothetical protein
VPSGAKGSLPRRGYRKKLIDPGGSFPLQRTYTGEQLRRRLSFYEELQRRREELPRDTPRQCRCFDLLGWQDTTTVRVYLRETVARIDEPGQPPRFWRRRRSFVSRLSPC